MEDQFNDIRPLGDDDRPDGFGRPPFGPPPFGRPPFGRPPYFYPWMGYPWFGPPWPGGGFPGGGHPGGGFPGGGFPGGGHPGGGFPGREDAVYSYEDDERIRPFFGFGRPPFFIRPLLFPFLFGFPFFWW